MAAGEGGRIMSLFPFLHLFTCVVYIWLGIFALFKNSRSLVNRLFAAVLFVFAIWALTNIVIHDPLRSKKIAMLAVHISAPAWMGISSFFLWFVLAFVGREDILSKKRVYIFFAGEVS